ncbi:MAG: tRNA uridine-5-carboxymethylaminomethyl(34) synthesis GTPase MnmE [Opitutae bacterium]|nr:tRNA uridine-5-carboxymethylaminomethyl(34) synthesis GTPase MnmE [Opitutae bacterium]
MLGTTDTIAALATPVGTAAIAVVRASGPAVATLCRAIFGKLPEVRTVTRADYRDAAGTLVDDVVFTYFVAPNSYTGEDTVEISCHGNPYIAQRILEDLLARGCRPADPGEFTKRAFLNGRMDLSQAEAVMDLIRARSERALAAANQQLRGSLGRHMQGLTDRLVEVLAQIEAYIDFPEEDLPAENRQGALRALEELLQATRRLIATAHYGAVLRDGIRTVIVGEPNAGKSSLLNRLVGHERALVSAEPGTTRDYLEECVVVGAHFLRLVDTAGLNPLATALEERGIKKTLEQAAQADLFLWVIDSTGPLPTLPSALEKIMSPANTIAIYNKVDLDQAGAGRRQERFRAVAVSALTGDGIDKLRLAIQNLTEILRTEVGEELIALNARHAHALEAALERLTDARELLRLSNSIELISNHLRCALESFGEIAGRVDNERVLDQLFARFCIGK